MKKVKRFIAGAVCPRCAGMDKLTMYTTDSGEQVRECVRCAYTDRMTDEGPVGELDTRVNNPRAGEPVLPHEDEIKIVQIMDRAKKPD